MLIIGRMGGKMEVSVMKKIKLMCAGMALVVAMSAPQVASAKMLPAPIEGSSTTTSASTGTTATDSTTTTQTGSATVEATLAGEVRNISLDEAMKLALENSADVLAAKNDLDDAKIDKEQAVRKAKDMSKYLSGSNYNMQLLEYSSDVYAQSLVIYENAYALQESAAKLQVINLYYSILCNEKAEEVAQYSYDNAKTQLKNVEARYNQGMATKLEKLQAEMSVNTAKTQLDAAKNTTVQTKRNFSVLLGADIETNWHPTSKLTMEPLLIADAAAKADEMVENAPSVKIADATLEIARLQFVQNSAGKKGTYAYQLAELAYDTAKIDHDNTVKTTKVSAKSMLENLSLAYSQCKIYDESQVLVDEVYRLSKLQYDNGLNTQSDVDSAAASVVSNESSKLSAMLQYNVLKTAIEQNIITTSSSSN